jgi:Ran GTPase-activating protein 1
MATSNKVFSLEGKGLKLDTAEDLEPHIADLRVHDVEEVRLLGNTLGIGACKLLGEVLATKKNLRVSHRVLLFPESVLLITSPSRWPTSPTSSPVDC